MQKFGSDPGAIGMGQSERASLVTLAVDKLDELAAESDTLAKDLHSTFGPVIFDTPKCEDNVGKEAISGSDLGRALMAIVDKLSTNFDLMRSVIESCDL